MKKILNIILVFLILLLNFLPLDALEVKALEACSGYEVGVAYSDTEIILACYTNYNDALKAMNEYDSRAEKVAFIKKNNIVINAKYALAQVDIRNESRLTSDVITYVFSTPEGAKSGSTGHADYLTYIAGTWGADAVFLDYNLQYETVKIKISGLTGWIKKSEVKILPLSKLYVNKLQTNTQTSLRLREGPGINYNEIKCGSVTCNSSKDVWYTYYPSKTTYNEEDGYTWYYVNYSSGVNGWFASLEGWIKEDNTMIYDGNTFLTYYYVNSNVLYHNVRKGYNHYDVYMVLGTAPFTYKSSGVRTYYLETGKKYFSFDGNYFYTDFVKMIDDYKASNYNNSINKEYPHFSYFTYLPSRAKSGYTAGTFNQAIKNSGYTAFPTDPKSYVNSDGSWVTSKTRAGLSMMYDIGDKILNAVNVYGTNALTIYSNALRESGTGTSTIAFAKNNLFGMGASDDAPFMKAYTYNSVQDSVNDYASKISSNTDYGNLYDYRYNGTHNGNKGSGIKVQYASDPYAGESSTGSSYNLDSLYGGLDNLSNTLGIKINSSLVNIYSEPSTTSRVIYQTKNYSNNRVLTNVPFVVFDKVYTYENAKIQGYYKVYTDAILTNDRYYNKDYRGNYNFEYCYGYIKEEDLYVQNKQPEITASDIIVEQNKQVNILSGVSASDYEDLNLTSKIVLVGSVDTSVPGEYPVTYTVKDSSGFYANKTVKVTVVPTEYPVINAKDIEIPQYEVFNPMTGVTVTDKKDGNLTPIIKTNTVNINVMGEYKIVYEVTNSLGLKTEYTRTVCVIKNDLPIIYGANKIISAGDSFDPLKNITAYDKEDGDITNKITVSGNVDWNTVGNYTITYSVIDNANQKTTLTINVTVEPKKYIVKDNMFYLEQFEYNTSSKKIDFLGFLVIKGINNKDADSLNYDIIFENQYTGELIIKSLSRLVSSKAPFPVPNDTGLDYSGAWFKESFDISGIALGDYTIYVRARSKDYEAKTLLKNAYFKKTVSSKFNNGDIFYDLKVNYYDKEMPLELFVRKNGTINTIINPTSDNMYNQVYSISLSSNGKVNIKGTSHNVNGDYAVASTVNRWIMFENINTFNIEKNIDVGSITNGPYTVSLKVSDGKNKTRAWYESSIDISDLPVGRYSIIIRTKTGSIDDSGELYDLTMSSISGSIIINNKKISLYRNDKMRFRIELIVEKN